MDDVWLFVLLLVILLIPAYSCYRVGRYLERRALTSYLVTSLEDECNECEKIGEQSCPTKP